MRAILFVISLACIAVAASIGAWLWGQADVWWLGHWILILLAFPALLALLCAGFVGLFAVTPNVKVRQ